MLKRVIQSLVVMVLVAGVIVFPVGAQDDSPELTGTFAFASGVSFAYPAGWALDESTASDFMVMLTAEDVLAGFMQVYDLPALYGEMPLELSFVQETYGSGAADTWGFAFSKDAFQPVEVDGRELSVLAFEGVQNDSPVTGYIVAVPYSDGGFGQITTYAVGEAPADYEQAVLAIAASMDVSAADKDGGGEEPAADDEDAKDPAAESVDVSAVELGETFAFTSGVSFAYPAGWALDEATASDFMVMLTAEDVLAGFMQVYDLPAMYGEMPLELSFVQETYGSNAAGTWGFEFDADDFQPVEVDGRELSVLAFEGVQNDSPATGYIVVVPYSDGGFGQITTYAVGEAPADYEQAVLAIAASMDVSAADKDGDSEEPADDEDAKGPAAESVDVSAIELSEPFVFTSGVSFAYPAGWALDEATASDFMVMLTAQDVLAGFMQVYDLPALYGEMPLELSFVQETYGSGAAGTWGFEFDADDFQPVEVDGRELSVLAFEGVQNDSPVTGYIVAVPYSDGGFGQITTYAVGEAPADYEQAVLAVAASMDVTTK